MKAAQSHICLFPISHEINGPASVQESDWDILEIDTFHTVKLIQNMVADILLSFCKQG